MFGAFFLVKVVMTFFVITEVVVKSGNFMYVPFKVLLWTYLAMFLDYIGSTWAMYQLNARPNLKCKNK